MSTMTVAHQRLRLEQADYREWLRQRRDRAMSRVCCPECGSVDGMVALYPEAVIAYVDEPGTYPWPCQGMTCPKAFS